MEFIDKAIDDKYGDLCSQEADLEAELATVQAAIQELIDNNEQA